MRIDRLTIQNFRKFEELTFELHPQFNLLVGANGSGKTTIIKALANALSVWSRFPQTGFAAWDIQLEDARIVPTLNGDRVQFQQQLPVTVHARGKIGEVNENAWMQKLAGESYMWVGPVEMKLPACLPAIAIYGVNRATVYDGEIISSFQKAQRSDAYKNWFDTKINYGNLRAWLRDETTAAGANKGRYRPGYEAVRRAILDCLPDADELWFDVDYKDLVCSINGQAQPLSNLSDGQRMLLAMVADLAIKAVTLNAYLLPPDTSGTEERLLRVLKETPGVVLIDELDLHLHPSWQRRVAADLKRTFPSIQFIATSHSPQIIGELEREEIRLLKDDRVELPPVARGADSNWILDHVMENSASENLTARQLKDEAEEALAEGDLSTAHKKLEAFRDLLDGETGDLIRLESSLATLEALEGVGV